MLGLATAGLGTAGAVTAGLGLDRLDTAGLGLDTAASASSCWARRTSSRSLSRACECRSSASTRSSMSRPILDLPPRAARPRWRFVRTALDLGTWAGRGNEPVKDGVDDAEGTQRVVVDRVPVARAQQPLQPRGVVLQRGLCMSMCRVQRGIWVGSIERHVSGFDRAAPLSRGACGWV